MSYNSASQLRASIAPLCELDWVRVIVVDNASSDGTLDRVADLDLIAIPSLRNVGFAGGCNVGWRAGHSPYVLFLNPDARIGETSLRRLVDVLESRPSAGLAAPRIVGSDGRLQHSLRRYPRLRSTYAQAFFLDRFAPDAPWADEIKREDATYLHSGPQEWVSGACVLARRLDLERLGGWDDGFFLYCEDIDLCRRLQDLGFEVWFDAQAVVKHDGGRSAPRAATLPFLAASRVRYARLHRSRAVALLERLGIAAEAATHMLVARGGRAERAAHARSLLTSLGQRAAIS